MPMMSFLYAVLVCGACIVFGSSVWLQLSRSPRPGGLMTEPAETAPAAASASRPDRFAAAMQDALDTLDPVALIVLRLPGEGEIPATAEERLMQAVVRALGRAGGTHDPVFRIGERAFALIVRRPGPDERLLGAAWRALDTLHELIHHGTPSHAWNSSSQALQAHVGIAAAPRDGTTVAELVDRACGRVEVAIRTGYRVIAADPGEFALPSATPREVAASRPGGRSAPVARAPRGGMGLVSPLPAGQGAAS